MLDADDLARHNYAVGLRAQGGIVDVTAPATELAKRWDGWGTAMKPATESWVLARKPLDGTVASNIKLHGTGALNIDGCRVGSEAIEITNYKSTGAQGCMSHGAGGAGGHAGKPYQRRESTGR